MSWIGGSFVINDLSKKELNRAYLHIDRRVKSNSDLVEFPSAGARFPIKEIKSKPFETMEAAESFLRTRNDWQRNWNVAVPFYDRSACKPTSKHEECLKRLQSEEDKYAAYIKAHDLSTFKSVLITCKKCGSKLNKDYLKRSCCPLCKNDLRSNSVKAASDRYEEKIRKLKKDIQTEEAKASGKAVLRYLVMYEEYCG